MTSVTPQRTSTTVSSRSGRASTKEGPVIIDSLHGPWPWATQAKYAQAVRAGDLILTGGIGPFDEEGDLINGDCAAQVRQTFSNLRVVLAEFGCGLEAIASMTVFVSDQAAYETFQAVRPDYLGAPYPASTAVAAGRLLVDGMRIEINAIAYAGANRVPFHPGDPDQDEALAYGG